MTLPFKPRGGCQHLLENGEKCGEKIDGRGARLYCSDCGAAAQKEAERRRNKKDSAKFRNEHPDLAIRNKFLCENQLTENKLEPLLKRGDFLREQYAKSRDDFHEFIVKCLYEIGNTLLTPPAELPRVAITAKADAETLLHALRQKQRDSRRDPVLNHLILCIKALLRDTGHRVSSEAFTEMRKEAKTVQELCRQQGELLSLIQALFVGVERYRLQFLADPTQRQFLQAARVRLAAAEYLCDRAINRSTGQHKQTANLLSYYVPLFEATLALDGDEREQAADSIQVIKKRANVVAHSAGEGPMTETVQFLCAVNQAELNMRLKKIACAYEYFKQAEHVFSNMQRRSLESHLYIAYVKAGIALATKSANREEDVQEFILQFQRHPFLTHYQHLEELKRLYPKDIDESLFKGVPI